MAKDKIQIRSSAAEFLIFEQQTREQGVQVRFERGDLWLTQKAIAELYHCSTDNVGLHLKNIYSAYELDRDATTEHFSAVQTEGGRTVTRNNERGNSSCAYLPKYSYFCTLINLFYTRVF